MENFTVKNEKLELTVCSKGAEIQSVKVNGEQKVWQGGSVWKGKAPLLFPMAGALKNKKYLHNGKEYEHENDLDHQRYNTHNNTPKFIL